ncbi:MAG TPA: hypothetical protein VLL05_01485 [Terriglobales bacterium]|nr:hypothetical protein [Terriglobales bacterium]
MSRNHRSQPGAGGIRSIGSCQGSIGSREGSARDHAACQAGIRSICTKKFKSIPPDPDAAAYETLWGVGSFGAKVVESGEMVRFSYRVLDPEKAAVLNDKHNDPALIDEAAHVKLSVPTLEKVGQLRQSSNPEAGKVYWMVFSNKERYVKRGDRVSVVIGKFRVDNLLVE